MDLNHIKSQIKNTIGINVNERQANLFEIYVDLLCEENKLYNLTGFKTKEDIFKNLVLDSLTVFELKNKFSFAGKKILDIGTGAGIPGIPIKIMDDSADMILIESTKKKSDFVKKVISLMELTGIEVVNERADACAKNKEFAGVFDVVLAKALASLGKSLECAAPFLKIGGVFITYKGKKFNEELREAQKNIKKLNFELEEVFKIENTGKKLVVFTKKEGI